MFTVIKEILEKFSKNALKKNKGVPLGTTTPDGNKIPLIQDFINTQNAYEKELKKNLISFVNGKIDKTTYLEKQKIIMKTSFSDAYLLGKKMTLGLNTTLDASENGFIGKAVSDEMKFMEKFATDVANKTGKMAYMKRIKMYSDSLSALFGFGRLVYMPDEVKIIWTLGVTDKHCPDCLSIVAKNPYTKKTLPGYPKSGSTICLSNCRCSLRYVLNNTQEDYNQFLSQVKPSKSRPNIPDEMQFNYLMNQKNRFFEELYNNAYSGSKQTSANDIQKEINTYLKNNKMTFIPLEEMKKQSLKDFNLFKSHLKFKKVNDMVEIKSGDIISIFQSEKQSYAKVKRKFTTGAEVTYLDGTTQIVNERSMIFKYVE